MKLYAENLREGQNKRAHNLENLGGIHQKNATHRDFVTEESWKKFHFITPKLGEFIAKK